MAKLLLSSLAQAPDEYDPDTLQSILREIELALQSKDFPQQVESTDNARSIAWFLGQMSTFYKNAKVDLTTTDVTTLYTAPTASSTTNPATAIFKSILVADDSGSASTITLTITDTSSNVFVLFNVKATTGNGTVELLSAPLVVEEGEALKVTAGNANRLHVVGSYLEITRDD